MFLHISALLMMESGLLLVGCCTLYQKDSLLCFNSYFHTFNPLKSEIADLLPTIRESED